MTWGLERPLAHTPGLVAAYWAMNGELMRGPSHVTVEVERLQV
jgi:hypothetical protein